MKPLELTQHGPVIPVIVIEHLEHAVPLAKALLKGGIKVLEITLRTAVALEAIRAIRQNVPDAIVGAGTVRSVADVQRAHEVGCQFAVSPGYTHAVGEACQKHNLALLPGVATASEIMQAQADGFHFLKFFPATAAGGLPLLKAWAGPFSDVVFCPTGGITLQNAPEFLALPQVRVCGGSWLTPAQAMAQGDWDRIIQLACEASALSAP
jgi:2-dehydro-3-deoxyphosphogluconate aldolase / (4S)-4-hydroxy-2-oxoglutarate aldolase